MKIVDLLKLALSYPTLPIPTSIKDKHRDHSNNTWYAWYFFIFSELPTACVYVFLHQFFKSFILFYSMDCEMKIRNRVYLFLSNNTFLSQNHQNIVFNGKNILVALCQPLLILVSWKKASFDQNVSDMTNNQGDKTHFCSYWLREKKCHFTRMSSFFQLSPRERNVVRGASLLFWIVDVTETYSFLLCQIL